jgi:proteasome beta subunit
MTRQDRGPDEGHDGIAPRSQFAGGELGRAWIGDGYDTGPIDEQDQTGGAAPRFDTGTTVVGVAIDEAVVMAADRRMSLGGRFTANKSVRKVEQVHPTAAMGISGSVGPAQDLLRRLRAEASLYESRRGEAMSLDALARTAGGLIRGLPVTPLLGGVEPGIEEGGGADDGDAEAARARVYELDGGGSVLADDYAATGSGMQVAYGVLERRYDRGASVEAAREAAVAAVAAASERDTASGNGVTVTTVTGEGVETVAREEAAAGEVV